MCIFLKVHQCIALQTHAVERQFNNWFFHVLLHDHLRYFESVFFESLLVHPLLTQRLQSALDLLKLQCVNQDLRTQCTAILHTQGIVVADIISAARPVRALDHLNTKLSLNLDSDQFIAYDDIRTVFQRVRRVTEEEHGDRDGSLRLIWTMLEKLCLKNEALGFEIGYYHPKEHLIVATTH